MIDLPAGWLEKIQNIDWAEIKEKVQDYGPALRVLRETWSRETLTEISQGKLFVPDEVLNEAIERRLAADPGQQLKKLTLKSYKNGRLEIRGETEKERLTLKGKIKEFVHRGDESYVVYHVTSKSWPGHGLNSWLFSLVSLSMVERMVGDIQISEALPLEIKHNDVRIDCSQVLADSKFGQTEYQGQRLLDMLEIKSATPKEGGIEFETDLHVSDKVKEGLRAVLQGRDKDRDASVR